VTPSVAAPGDTNPSDATVVAASLDSLIRVRSLEKIAFLPRQTTHECVYLRSRDEYDGHTIQPKTARAELLPLKVSYYGNRKFHVFCSCDLDFDPMTFIHERDVIGVDRIFSGMHFFS